MAKLYQMSDLPHLMKAQMSDNGFTSAEGSKLANQMGIDFGKEKFGLAAFVSGLNVELEHKDVTHAKAVATAKIALAHLRERPDYYARLKRYVEKSGLAKGRKLHGRTTFHGLDISVENRKGSYRYWWDDQANEQGKTKMLYPYGYIRGTEGTDGDHVDVYVGPNKDATHVYVIDQGVKNNWKKFDEQKVMLGFNSAAEAKKAYLHHYNDPRFFQAMKEVPVENFVMSIKHPSQKGKKIRKYGIKAG